MTLWCLEMCSTEDQEVRYREYTKSLGRAGMFIKIDKLQFTNSGHGVVPVVREWSGRRLPAVLALQKWVDEKMEALQREAFSARQKVAKEKRRSNPSVTAKLDRVLKNQVVTMQGLAAMMEASPRCSDLALWAKALQLCVVSTSDILGETE